MCGRYLRRSDKQRIAEAFRLGTLPDNFVLPPDRPGSNLPETPFLRRSSRTVG